MVRVTEELALSPDHVTLYQTSDPLLGHLPILIFHGPSTTANYTFNSSRVQVHIYTPAGFQSFPRLTISPNSPFYNAVNHLPREFQGDEVYRALAFGLSKYFHELPESAKSHIRHQYPTRGRRPGSAPTLFSEQHAAELAKSVARSDNTPDVIQKLQVALQTQHINNIDIDMVLPPGAIIPLQPTDLEDVPEDEDDIMDPTLRQYGMYTPLVKLFGEPIFLPTSRLRRAPSKPSALNRSKSFSRDQKTELRRNMAELVETEERYVMKLNELVNNLAHEYRQKAQGREPESFSPSEEQVDQLFPKSSEKILELNTLFMQQIRRVLNETEETAAKDVESGTSSSRIGPSGSTSGRPKDASGAVAMARIMLEWFPKFTECYQDYIRASQNFPQLITSFVSQQSSFSKRVALTGEQHLRSTVIEPVQRLPRYSLVIDQIVGCLPITHPALQPMLKARDIIADICSMDDPLADKPHMNTRLRNMIEDWPSDLEPQGRLIVAADFYELVAPYQVGKAAEADVIDRTGILLLFSDCVIIVKAFIPNLKARDLLREIDKPSPAGLLASMTNAAGGPGSYELGFAGWHSLADVRFTESSDGRSVWMASTKEMRGTYSGEYVTSTAVTCRCFIFQESYEGKAAKWGEDVVKARIEGRFSEQEREDPCWTLRAVRMPDTGIGLHVAVFQEGLDQLIDGRKEPAPIRIVVDHDRGTKGSPVGHYGVEISSDIKTVESGQVVVVTVGLHGKKTVDEVSLEDFLPTFSRRIIHLLSTQYNVTNPALCPAMVSFHSKILRSLSPSKRTEKTRSFLSSSPVKYLSSFLGGGSGADAVGTPQQRNVLEEAPLILPGQISRANSSREAISLFGSAKSREGIRAGNEDDGAPENPLVRLEQTFTGYMASLQARKGNIVGRTLLNRATVDELSVNDLYNKLIESPFDIDYSEDLGADVVFTAFEKFVRIAWREQMGSIMTLKALDALQERASKKVPGEFADFVNYLFSDMAPQNRRAFISLIKLLADLLDGCSNDGDRGALTLAFAELLVDDNSAHNYINLLDKLVEDCDRIFDDSSSSFNATFSRGDSVYESLNSANRSLKSQTPSLTSHTSSIRKKFGLDTLLRQNSKNESEYRPSVWRTLSKHGRSHTAGESTSLSKGSVNRARSIDMGPNKLRRPGSRDRPLLAGAFEESLSRPTSSHRLETIGEPGSEHTMPKTPRRKRRSSLSDLRSLMASASIDEDEAVQEPLSDMQETSEKFNSSPRNHSPSKIPVSPYGPSQQTVDRHLSSRQKESSDEARNSGAESPRKKHNKTVSTSQIPTLRAAHSSIGTDAEFTSRVPTSPTKTPGRLKLQSPQKLRERLQEEKRAAEEVDASLQSELSKIAADMARVNSVRNATATPGSTGNELLRNLTLSVQSLEERLPQLVSGLSSRHDQLRRDMEGTLRASEDKVKAVDQLYKESTAENELLYERFNSELGKIVRALKGKGRDDKEELVGRMKECSEETARVKKENARLRREMAGLRAIARAASGGGSSSAAAIASSSGGGGGAEDDIGNRQGDV